MKVPFRFRIVKNVFLARDIARGFSPAAPRVFLVAPSIDERFRCTRESFYSRALNKAWLPFGPMELEVRSKLTIVLTLSSASAINSAP